MKLAQKRLSLPPAIRAPAITLSLLAVGTALLAVRSPHVSGSYGACPLLLLTGTYCAGCGILRASHDLAHLDVASAWQMNPLWVLLVPFIVLALGWWTWTRYRVARAERVGLPRPTYKAPGPILGFVGVGVLVVYSVARNVPVLMPLLAPGVAS